MIIFKFFFLLLRFFIYTFFIFINYFVLIALKLFYFILFLPLSLYSILNTFLFFIFLVLKHITYLCFNYFKRFYFYLKVVHVSDPVYQLLSHLTVLGVIKEKCFRRYYFYRRLYWLSGRSFKSLIKGILTVELNALLIKRLTQPLKSPLLKKIWELPSSYTRIGYYFRIFRRVIKLLFGIFTFFYPLQLALKFGVWYFTDYLLQFLRVLKRKKLVKTQRAVKNWLKAIIWLKLLFVWSDIPFVLLFKPGISKKYPQFEDIQPDTRIVRHEIWEFTLARDCYFDYEDVINGYYIFHTVRKLSKLFFNFVIFNFVIFYFVIINFLYLLQILYFLFYIPFKVLYINHFFNFLILGLKFVLVFSYFVPVFCVFIVILFFYFIYKFFSVKFRFFNLQKQPVNWFLNFWNFGVLGFIKERFILVIYYVVFKFRALNYLVFSSIKKFISIKDLLGIDFSLYLNRIFNVNPQYANLLYYNTSYIFKRIRPYFLRFNNLQFISFFFKVQKTSRITPDQLKSFLKLGQNSRYPVDYFEKLFDLEYSKLELEYELPYYWSFVRQAHSLNEGLLHPKFHAYGLLNFIKFYWNYFSFLNTTSSFEIDSIYARDFMQLLNSSASQVFSLLVNDFVVLIGFKKFKKYSNLSSSPLKYFRFSKTVRSTQWYSLHVRYYDKLIHFFWDYYDKLIIRVLYYYYFVGSSGRFIKIYSFFNDYVERGRHIFGWYVFLFYERMMGKLFLNVNKFEDYYDVNFDKALARYNLFIIYLNYFFGVTPTRISSKQVLDEEFSSGEGFSDNEESIRLIDYAKKMDLQRKKNYNETMSDFFTGSFSIFGNFYVFARDNIFEFMTVLHTSWREYVESTITRWSKLKKLSIFFISFFNTMLIIWFSVLLILILFFLFLAKALIIIIIKKIKKIYV